MKLKANGTGLWLVSNRDGKGMHVQAIAHGNDRFIEYITVNYDAPKHRKWEIRIVDTTTGADCALAFPDGHFDENRAKAMTQVNCPRPGKLLKFAA